MDATAEDIAEMTKDELRLVLVDTQLQLAASREEVTMLERIFTTDKAAQQLPAREPAVETDVAADNTKQEAPGPYFACAADWVNGWMVAMTARTFAAWCEQWWLHDEAAIRVEAMWRGWEIGRLDPNPLAMSTWMLHHFDPHLAALADSEGPFTQCGRHHHTLPRTEITPPIAAPEASQDTAESRC